MSSTVQSPTAVKPLHGLVPMAFVADVQKSIDFYQQLGFKVENTFTPPQGELAWAWLRSGTAHLMVSRSSRPMNPDAQDVLFYLYAEGVKEYREQLIARGLQPGELQYPFYAQRGEFRITDPDGYCLLIGDAEQK